MATLTLRPNAAGDLTGIAYQYPSSTYHWDKCDESVADDAETYVYNAYNGEDGTDLYNLDNTSQTGHITSVVIYCRFYYSYYGTSDIQIAIKTGGTVYYTTLSKSAYWATYSRSYSTNPKVGGAWTWTQINASQAGGRLKQDASVGVSLRLTQVYVEVNYEELQNYSRSFSIKMNLLKKATKKIGKKLKKSIKLITKYFNRNIGKSKKVIFKIVSKLTKLIRIKRIYSKVINLLVIRFQFDATKVKNIWVQISLNSSISKKISVSTIFKVINSLLISLNKGISTKKSSSLILLSVNSLGRGRYFIVKTLLTSKIYLKSFIKKLNIFLNTIVILSRKVSINRSLISSLVITLTNVLGNTKILEAIILLNSINLRHIGFVAVGKFSDRIKLIQKKNKSIYTGLRSRYNLIFRNPTGKR